MAKTKWKKYRLFLLSDLIFQDPKRVIASLKKVKNRNQAFILRIHDEMENKLPIKGFYQLVNTENGHSSWVNGFSGHTNRAMNKKIQKNISLWESECKNNHFHITSISTKSDIYSKLNGFF